MSDQSESHRQTNGVNGHATIGIQIPSTEKRNAWEAPGPAAFDFRSDTVTTPTASMLAATSSCTLFDDVFAEDPTTNDLEAFIAELTGKEAALFVTSGTMGNQLSIRTALGGPPHSVLADSRSHVIGWEAGGIASLSGAMPIPIAPRNTHHLTLPDIQHRAITSSDAHYAPTTLISLENTLGGSILPLADCIAISNWARAQTPPIWMHLDGARLWEAVAARAGGLKDYAACFDSLTVCFSKGLGAPVGSVVCGKGEWVGRARRVRKMMGGGLRQAGVVTAAARVAVEETFLGGKLIESHKLAKEIEQMWLRRGGKVEREVETNMVWLDLEAAGCERERWVEVGVREGVRLLGGRVVCHYQICGEAVRALGRVMDAVLGGKGGKGGKGYGEGKGDGERGGGGGENGGNGVCEEKGVTEEAAKVMEPEME